MTRPVIPAPQQDFLSSNRVFCPRWCVAAHNVALGEEDWLHTSEPVRLADGARAHLAMSIDPDTCDVDGPYVMVGDTELTLADAAALATSLLALVTSHAASRALAGPAQDRTTF